MKVVEGVVACGLSRSDGLVVSDGAVGGVGSL